MALVIAQADLDDPAHASGIVSVLDSYASDPIGGGRPLRPEIRERLIPGLRKQANALVLLAFDGDAAVGLAVCFFGFSTFAARPLLNVHDLAVVPERRGNGIGTALLTEAERRARAHGSCKLTLEVQEHNDRARAVYAKFGFTDYVLGGEPVPTRFLTKLLDD